MGVCFVWIPRSICVWHAHIPLKVGASPMFMPVGFVNSVVDCDAEAVGLVTFMGCSIGSC